MKNPRTEYVRDILYMTSENEFIVVYAGLMISAEGFKASPSIQDTTIRGKIKRVVVPIVQNALIGKSELVAVVSMYDT